ncbi:MAG TPA: polysaccharide deacetylase family protein [Nitrososphaeraceae archaeon]|jgi:peptidoglycan/xylan/chitin deacetylase (PgdA/CDA1 family)|nr:polysaccharide deacetylase family protein [Nitrososphaeraceae archaeon]
MSVSLIVIASMLSFIVIAYFIHDTLGQITSFSNQIGNEGNLPNSTTEVRHGTNKFIVLNFDDSYKSQFTYAKPILDKYGFKATFFLVCDWIGSDSEDDKKMTWSDIAKLRAEGHDIEAHTMTHPHLNKLSSSELEYEISQSKQCLLGHGINSTIFAYPYGEGWDNPNVFGVVSKYYDLARSNSETPLTFLNDNNISDVHVFSKSPDNNMFVNRYAINSWNHRHIEGDYSPSERECEGSCIYYNSSQMLQKFIEIVDSQDRYNTNGKIRAIPIIVYHTIVNYPDLSDSTRPVDATVDLFEKEMKYLYDNNYNVLLMSDLT